MSNEKDNIKFDIPGEEQNKSNSYGLVTLVLLILVTLLLVYIAFFKSDRKIDVKSASSATDVKELAKRLEKSNIKEAAIENWLKYIRIENPSDEEKAKLYYKIAKLYSELNNFEKSLEYYFLSETIYEVSNLSEEIKHGIKESFRRMGNVTGLQQEISSKTKLDKDVKDKSPVVAEIGADKITMNDLQRKIEDSINIQLQQYAQFLSPEQLGEQKEQLLKKYETPEAKMKFLQDLIGTEVLQRKAYDEKLDRKPELERMIEHLRRQLLAQEVINSELIKKVNVTESDIKDYYEAHKDEFIEKEKVKVSVIKVEDKAKADEILSKLKSGKLFKELANEYSIDRTSKENDGMLDNPIEKAGYIPGIGNDPDVHTHLFTLDEGSYSKEPIKVKDDYYVFKVHKKIPKKQLTFNEALPNIKEKKLQTKKEEVMRGLINSLKDKYKVVIHASKFKSGLPDDFFDDEKEDKN